MHPLAPKQTVTLRSYDVDFAAVGPGRLVGLPCGGPRSTALRHVADVEAGRPRSSDARTPGSSGEEDIHRYVRGVRLHAADADAVASGSARAQYRGVISTQNERVSVRVGQVL